MSRETSAMHGTIFAGKKRKEKSAANAYLNEKVTKSATTT
jgi:hypothetical protein